MPRKYRKPEEVAASIAASMSACRAIVAAFATGALRPVPIHGSRPWDIRYAPYFRTGMPSSTIGVPYVLGHITAALLAEGKNTLVHNGNGHFTANRYIALAMRILAGIEEGWLDEDFLLENLRSGTFRIAQLSLELRAHKQEHNTAHALLNKAATGLMFQY